MPKRIGFLCEQVLTLENCTAAVLEGTDNLRRTPSIKRIRENPEVWGRKVLKVLTEGWIPGQTREKIINEGTGHKIRRLQIPNTFDHLCHVAIMRPLIPELMKRYDFYSCGSIPGRGQKRVMNALKAQMCSAHPPKYAAELDVHHAYESTSAEVVMSCLRRIIKDEKYLKWHAQILEQMEGHLAIGFQPSHWYFNLVMTKVDMAVRTLCKGVSLVRYMDNYILTCNRKRTLHKAVHVVMDTCGHYGLSINKSWQVFPTAKRAISMLSYRYFQGYVLLRKQTMYEMTARIKTAGKKMCAHLSRGALSRIGLLRHCNSYNYRKKYIYPVFSINRAKELISNVDKKCSVCGAA